MHVLSLVPGGEISLATSDGAALTEIRHALPPPMLMPPIPPMLPLLEAALVDAAAAAALTVLLIMAMVELAMVIVP